MYDCVPDYHMHLQITMDHMHRASEESEKQLTAQLSAATMEREKLEQDFKKLKDRSSDSERKLEWSTKQLAAHKQQVEELKTKLQETNASSAQVAALTRTASTMRRTSSYNRDDGFGAAGGTDLERARELSLAKKEIENLQEIVKQLEEALAAKTAALTVAEQKALASEQALTSTLTDLVSGRSDS